jgi:hypothetical protein
MLLFVVGIKRNHNFWNYLARNLFGLNIFRHRVERENLAKCERKGKFSSGYFGGGNLEEF